MTGILYAEINIICIVIMVILLVNLYRSNEDKIEKRIFLALTFCCTIMFSSDAVWALVDAEVIHKTFETVYISNTVYFAISGFAGFSWYLFAECLYTVKFKKTSQYVQILIISVPAFAIFLMAIFNFKTSAFFYIDENLNYHRGNLHFIQAGLAYFYEFYVLVRGVVSLATTKDVTMRKRYRQILLSLVLPMAATVAQVFNGFIPTLCVGTTLAELLVYIYISSKEKELLIINKSEQERSILEQALSSTLSNYKEIYYIQFRKRSQRMLYPVHENDVDGKDYELLFKRIRERLSKDDANFSETNQFFDLSRARTELMRQESIEHKYCVEYGYNDKEWVCANFIVNEVEAGMPVSAFLTIRSIQDILSKEQEQKRELENALAMAEAANIAKSTFLNNMSHDIRTPMNAILGFTDMAHKEIDNKEKLSDYLYKISKSGQHLLTLINDVLDMSSIESGKTKFNHVSIDVFENVDLIKSMFSDEAKKKNINFTVEAKGITDRYVFADELRARQVGVNIISNAFKYTPNGGNIKFSIEQLSCEKEGFARYLFVIEDDGIGMSQEFKAQIFDSFTRERTSTLSGVQGTGLGMAIVKKIVDMIDGKIDVESNVGEGTKISIDVTLKIATPKVEKKEDSFDIHSVNFKGKRVLLVEDNELNKEIAQAILEELGIIVECAMDGQEAVIKMAESVSGYFDLVLMDIQMPIMDGYTATKKIRELDDISKTNIPIVAMTANAFEQDKQHAKNVGMNGHISKPIDIDEMVKTMKKCMGL